MKKQTGAQMQSSLEQKTTQPAQIGLGAIFCCYLILTAAACSPQRSLDRKSVDQSISSGIVGGTEVPNESPLAKVVVALYDTQAHALCTGTLLGNNFILTAAHCVGPDPRTIAVVFNNDLKTVAKGRVLRVDAAATHPEWQKGKVVDSGDIALLHYQGFTPQDYKYAQVLPASRANIFHNGQLILLAGYGLSDGIKKEGAGILRQVSIRVGQAKFSATEVAMDQRDGKGACNGDSGGPAFIGVGNQYYVWGVTSRGEESCKVDGIYTNAAMYQQWLADTARDMLASPQDPRWVNIKVRPEEAH